MENIIKEIARTICGLNTRDGCFCDGGYCNYNCLSYEKAEALYNAGYRKQSEGEWKDQVRVSKEGKPLLRHYKCSLCGVYLATRANFCPNCGAKMKGGAE